MNEYKSCVVKQISNGFVLTVYLPSLDGGQPTESETYYSDITSCTAAISAVL